MVYNEIKPGDISCLSFLKGTKYALYVGPELNEVQREQLKLKTLPFPVLYLPEIFGQLSDAVCQYNFPGVRVTEALSVEEIYARIRAESGDEIILENRLIIRYVNNALVVFDAKMSFSLLISYLLSLRGLDADAVLLPSRKASMPKWKTCYDNLYEAMNSDDDDPEKMEESVTRLVDPFDNSINEKCASVKKAFVLKIADDIAANYYIAGEQGKHKRISLDRSLVDWECELQ